MLTNQGHPASSPFTHPSRPGPTCGAVTGCDSWFICSLLSDHPALEDQGAGVKAAQRWVGLGWARLAAVAGDETTSSCFLSQLIACFRRAVHCHPQGHLRAGLSFVLVCSSLPRSLMFLCWFRCQCRESLRAPQCVKIYFYWFLRHIGDYGLRQLVCCATIPHQPPLCHRQLT